MEWTSTFPGSMYTTSCLSPSLENISVRRHMKEQSGMLGQTWARMYFFVKKLCYKNSFVTGQVMRRDVVFLLGFRARLHYEDQARLLLDF